MRLLASSFAILLVLGAAALAQSPQPGQPSPPSQPSTTPQRMPARPLRPGEAPPKGTAVLRGQVMASGTGTPVRRAQVRAMSMEGRGGGVTSTDNEGRYEIKELTAGRYTVTTMKGGYANASYGQKRPGEPGTPIDLGDGQTAEKVNFVLSRGSVIAGRLIDDGGEPVSGATVSAMRFAFVSGSRRLVPGGGEGGQDRTDDQGNFRLFGLPPGEYYVSASNHSNNMMMPGMNNTEADGFATTYYPGTANISEAARITVKASQEMTGANFAMLVARMARIKGRVLNSRGEPMTGGMLMLTAADPMIGMNFGMNMTNAMVGGDGTFQFANIAPGRYNLNVRPNGMPGGNSEFAMMPLTIGNDDIDNLLLTTSLGAVARGVIGTDDGAVPSFRPENIQIFPQTVDPSLNIMGGGPAKVSEDFTFEINNLFDRRLLRASVGNMAQSSGWYLKAVLFDGEDVTDRGIEFAPGRAYDGIQIVFTAKITDLSGLVMDDRNKPILDATVVIFPADREKWTYLSRYLRTLRPDTNGRYNVKAMPPLDDYLIIAVQNLEPGQFSDPDFLTRAKEEAKSFSLNEGETKAVDIKLSKLVP
ncbi:MAG: carboxypeptidase-like regulatory domain-containing protein [Vicinamibacterales bacterium]